MLLLFQYVILFSSFITFINGENLRTDNEYRFEVAEELSEGYSRILLLSPEQVALFQKILAIVAKRSKSVEERLAEIRPHAIELGTGQSPENSNDLGNFEEFWNSQKQIYKNFIKVNDQFYELVKNYPKDDADKILELESEIQQISFNTTLNDKSPDEIKSIFIEKLGNFEIEIIREWHKLKKDALSKEQTLASTTTQSTSSTSVMATTSEPTNSDSVCTPSECCDRLSNCSDIALSKQCKQHDYDCQLSCGTCNATERGYGAYYLMWEEKKADCSNGYSIGKSWDDFERATNSKIWTPNDVPYFPGYCLFGMKVDWEVPENCSQLEYWNKYFNRKLKFLHLRTHMHINTFCDTIPEFFKSVEIIMGQGESVYEYNTKCIVQINDMTGNRTIFDFFPNLKFVGLEYPNQLTGALICGNTIDGARLTEEQKDRINRIDQGRLWDLWQFRVDAVPPTGNSSSYSLYTPYGCYDRLSNCSDIALNKQCKQHDYDCQLSCGTCNATERGYAAYSSMTFTDEKTDCSSGYFIGNSWNGFEKATSSAIWTQNYAPYFPGYCLYNMKVDWEVPKDCNQLEHWNKYFNGKLKFLHLSGSMHINTSCGAIPEFFKSVEVIMGEGKIGYAYNTKCIVQINDMTGNRTIFDFFPNLKFVGLEYPKQLSGPLICGNTIDEARLSEEQKDRINRIDQGRLLGFGKLLGIA